ncbi:fatty acid desaturase [Rhizobium rhizosphaerae]|uniref:Fatty acid desaturase n=1 Tax=Xaviernesmea rhizosphaerae TaxID=1672749 RepID=A0A1Q9AHM4_9HYPH|nr:fatty acid desaturase [Xaviernesmea rhizosphaerae]OLP54743.1 fatty acid desaturase [Xaviernesmea rhizosphaerae]
MTGTEIQPLHGQTVAPIEWPTVALAGVIYGGYLAVTWWWASLPLPLVIVAGAWLIAWHGSLQHEVMHGHPTRLRWINDGLGWPPLSLWLPYALYRESHMLHHRDEFLTDPIEDPESSYFTRQAWERLGATGRRLASWNTTLLGRLTIGPAVMILAFLAQEAMQLRKGDRARLLLWLRHGAGVAIVLVWVVAICGMPLWLYLLGFVYGGASLSRIRSYAEHRYADHHEERTAIVENSPFLGLLFLHNNLHVLHHRRPGIPWYRLPALYRRDRQALIALNGGLLYNGYGDIFRRYLVTPHDEPRHPLYLENAAKDR